MERELEKADIREDRLAGWAQSMYAVERQSWPIMEAYTQTTGLADPGDLGI